MNKQSNTYTIIYIAVIVAVVGAALAFTAMILRPLQQANAREDTMKQILTAVHITADGNVSATFGEHITDVLIVNEKGQTVKQYKSDDAEIFDFNLSQEVKKAPGERQLPVYVCTTPDGTKYIMPCYGAGLWGPIWGYVAVDADGSTIYGAYFSHEGETPGLGAEIEKPAFQEEFVGKHLVVNGQFLPIAVVKAGQRPSDTRDYVDGISGGTITSKGVGEMLDNCLMPYKAFLESLHAK